MQEMIVALILIASFVIVFKRLLPNLFLVCTNYVSLAWAQKTIKPQTRQTTITIYPKGSSTCSYCPFAKKQPDCQSCRPPLNANVFDGE